MNEKVNGGVPVLTHVEQEASLTSIVVDAAHQAAALGRSAASIAGAADDLDNLSKKTTTVFNSVQGSLGKVITGNRLIAEQAVYGVHKAENTHKIVRSALDRASGLATAVDRVEKAITDVSGALKQVADASSVINRIAFQTRIVAFNASVEAVRAGDAGRGFGVVAQAVKDLAQQVGDSSRQIAEVIDQLSARVRALESQIGQGSNSSEDTMNVVIQAVESFEVNFGELEKLIRENADVASKNQVVCDQAVGALTTFGEEFSRSTQLIKEIHQESASLLNSSESSIQLFASCGVETEDTPFIEAAMRGAEEVAALLTEAVDCGEITLDALFDRRLAPLAGTNPQQYSSRYLELTDRLLPAVQEPMLKLSPLITFCAAVDSNAYLPTHNLKFS